MIFEAQMQAVLNSFYDYQEKLEEQRQIRSVAFH